MPSKFDNETNGFCQEELVDDYCDQDEDDLGDFIVYGDDDDESLKHNQRQQELEDEHEQELEDEVEEVEEEVEVEVEEEEEEAPVGQQEILSLREQLKEEIRKKNAAMAASSSKPSLSSFKNQKMPSCKIQNMPSVKDGYGTFFGPSKPVLARRVIEEGCSSIRKDSQNVPSKKDLASKMRPGAVETMQKLKFVSEEKRKVDTLRKNRDYSCLFSDDADTQSSTKDRPDSRGPRVPKSDTQVCGPVNSAWKSKILTGQPPTLSSTDHGLKGSGSLGKKKAHAERLALNKCPKLLPSSKGQKLQPSLPSKRPQTSIPGQKLRQRTQIQRSQASIPGQKLLQQSQIQRPQRNGCELPLQGRSLQGQHIGQNRSGEQNGRLKSAQKQLVSSSKFKSSRQMEKCAVKRKFNDGSYDDFTGSDEDESDMEADFASIQREERRSAALARKEDQEQLLLIQEEERRERTMKRKRAARKEQR